MNGVGFREYWPKEWPDWPEDPKARKVVEGLYEIGLLILNAPASLRKSRLKQADENAQDCLSQMTEEEEKQARALVALWERHALIQQRICYEEEKKGLDAVEHLWARWESAGMQMHKSEEEASQLGLECNEYFRSRVERFHILQEEKDEIGRYHNYPDYSKLREQWYSREPITAPLPWAWDHMLSLCKRFEVSRHRTEKRLGGRKVAVAGIVVTIAGIVVAVVLEIF